MALQSLIVENQFCCRLLSPAGDLLAICWIDCDFAGHVRTMIIGVTGFFAAGKDTVAEWLEGERAFAHLSLSDMIREALRAEGREVTIPNLTEKGNAIRREHGAGALAEMALEAMNDDRNYVVTSIRHPSEVEALRRGGDFTMVFVDAPAEVRFDRSRKRARPGDPGTFEQFQADEAAQMNSDDSSAQRLSACRDLADQVIVNDGTLEELHEKVIDAVPKP